MEIRKSFSEKIIDLFIYVFLGLFAFSCVYPLYQSFILSLNDGKDAMSGGIYFWPREFTLNNYYLIFSNDRLLLSFFITVARTLVGTLTCLGATSLLAYSLSKKQLVGGKIYTLMCIFTMYFGGGLIPTYLLIRTLGLRDNFLVYILPGMISVWNMLIFKSFFFDIPESLEESARIDGANYITIFFRIIIPVSKPVYAALGLFTAVGHWNEWFTATLYINNRNLLPMQTILNQMINATTAIEELSNKSNTAEMVNILKGVTTKSMIVTTMIVVTAPIILVYPFLQKYFVKGVMLGSIKG